MIKPAKDTVGSKRPNIIKTTVAWVKESTG